MYVRVGNSSVHASPAFTYAPSPHLTDRHKLNGMYVSLLVACHSCIYARHQVQRDCGPAGKGLGPSTSTTPYSILPSASPASNEYPIKQKLNSSEPLIRYSIQLRMRRGLADHPFGKIRSDRGREALTWFYHRQKPISTP